MRSPLRTINLMMHPNTRQLTTEVNHKMQKHNNDFLIHLFRVPFTPLDNGRIQEIRKRPLELVPYLYQNQNLPTYSWNKIMNLDEFNTGNLRHEKLPQIILYDLCLKYAELKELSKLLQSRDYIVHINSPQITLYKMIYHGLYGRMSHLSEFVTAKFSRIHEFNLFDDHDYLLFLKKYNEFKNGHSFNEDNTHVILLETLDAMSATLKVDYDLFNKEVYRINQLLTQTANTELIIKKHQARVTILSVLAIMISIVTGLFIIRDKEVEYFKEQKMRGGISK